MRYLYLVIAWFIYGCLPSFSQEVMYVYKSDGSVVSILESEIDSIYFSNINENMKETSDVVSQVIQTKDSMIVTLLCDIDSVGFHPLPMEKYPDVISMDDGLADFITGVDYDDLVLTLSSKTPDGLIPRRGDKLVTLKCTDILGYGFAGVVNEVVKGENGIEVSCDEADLSEFFKTLYLTTVRGMDDGNARAGTKAKSADVSNFYEKTWKFDLLKYSGITVSSGDMPSFEFSANGLVAEASHATKVFQSIVINNGTSMQTIKVFSNIHAGVSASFAARLIGELGPDQMPKFPLYGCPLANLYISAGPYAKAEVEVAADVSFNAYYSMCFEFEQNLRDKSVRVVKCLFSDNNKKPLSVDKILLNGKLGLGIYAEVGMAAGYYKKPKRIAALRAASYWESEGSYMIHNKDLQTAGTETTMYDNLRKTTVNNRWKNDLDLIYKNVKLNILSVPNDMPSFDLVPKFEFTRYRRNGSKRLFVAVNTNSNLLFASDVDCVAKTANGEMVSAKNTIARGEQNQKLEFVFDEIGNGVFDVHPRCTFMGITMLASPSRHILTIDSKINGVEDVDAVYSSVQQINQFNIRPKYDMPSYGLNDEMDKIYVWRSDDEYVGGGDYKNGESYWAAVKDGYGTLFLDYTNYVAMLPISIGIIKWFKIGDSDEWSYLATDFYDHICVYDEKPSITYNSVYVTGTSLVGMDEYGNVKYKTSHKCSETWKGLFWMKCWQSEITNGWFWYSTGTNLGEIGYNDYNKSGTREYDGYTTWWSNGKKNCTWHENITLRNGTKLTSNYIYFNQGNVSVMKTNKGDKPVTLSSMDRPNIVGLKENIAPRQNFENEMKRSNGEFDDIAIKYLRR